MKKKYVRNILYIFELISERLISYSIQYNAQCMFCVRVQHFAIVTFLSINDGLSTVGPEQTI